MIICDTSIWIEFFRNRSPYYDNLSAQLESEGVLGLECIFGELLQGVNGKKERNIILECWEGLPKYSEPNLWLEAGEYSAIHGLPARGVGLIDAAIAVAALKTGFPLWTLDKKLQSILPARSRYR
jgi:predicted nucleic acid-binding protein